MRLRYFFDPGSRICLWAADEESRAFFGYAIEFDSLNLSRETAALGRHLVSVFDGSVNWDDPAGESPWSEEQKSQFVRERAIFYERLVSELGAGFTVVNDEDA